MQWLIVRYDATLVLVTALLPAGYFLDRNSIGHAMLHGNMLMPYMYLS
jgi:hypothetical protein